LLIALAAHEAARDFCRASGMTAAKAASDMRASTFVRDDE
jgi:hypothetical protein